MDPDAQEIEGVVADLTHAMAGLLRVIDAKGAAVVAPHLSDALSDALDELVSRLNAIRGFAGD